MAKQQNPKPRSTQPLIAPDMQHEVQHTIDTHPEIDSMDEEARGEIIDITDWRINPGNGEKPWGRKARNNDPNNPNCNTDGMTFLRPDGLFEIYDVISGSPPGNSTWAGYGPYEPGENGYWWPPQPTEHQPEPPSTDLIERVEALEEVVHSQGEEIDQLSDQVTALTSKFEEFVTNGLHAHGPVDLPIVLESLTRLRAKGDIDVEVKPGQATPPDMSDMPGSELTLSRLKGILIGK
jgi:hypothetical protein